MDITYKIRSTQNKLADMIALLDSFYTDVKETQKTQKEMLDKQCQNFDRRNIIFKITKRMVYINKSKLVLTSEDNARLDELSKLLDWLEDE